MKKESLWIKMMKNLKIKKLLTRANPKSNIENDRAKLQFKIQQ